MPEQPDPFELFGLEAAPPPPPLLPPPPTQPVPPGSSEINAEPINDAPMSDDGDDGDGGDYVSVRGGGGRGGRWALLIGVPLLVIALLIGATGFWVQGKINPGSPGEDVAFTVPKGATTSQIATALAEKKVVLSVSVFEWYVKWKGGDPFQAGDYEGLRVNSSMGDVVDIL
ncbi:MAG: endolytic transglycosylase MltG, partial [Acidimicrobiia bacterium]|nr:endolytic transglycosylase MltG [Acidimicrobiia bacterium]